MIQRWFIWTILAVACWGVWAVASKLLGNALSATHSQALSTLGLFPVMIALGLLGFHVAHVLSHVLLSTISALSGQTGDDIVDSARVDG